MENDENEVHVHGRISLPVNRKREIDDRKSTPLGTTGCCVGARVTGAQSGRSKDQKKNHVEMIQNPEFDTQSWPTLNAGETKTSPNLSQQRFGGLGVRVFQMLEAQDN